MTEKTKYSPGPAAAGFDFAEAVISSNPFSVRRRTTTGSESKEAGRPLDLHHPQAGPDGVGDGRGNVAAGEARGIGVLIVDPDLHPELLAGVNGVAEEGQPFLGQVGCDQTGPGMDEDSADAVGPEVLHLFVDLGGRDPVVPDPQRSGAVFGRRILERLQDRGVGVRGAVGGAEECAGARPSG